MTGPIGLLEIIFDYMSNYFENVNQFKIIFIVLLILLNIMTQ
jgi:hypothetical protein